MARWTLPSHHRRSESDLLHKASFESLAWHEPNGKTSVVVGSPATISGGVASVTATDNGNAYKFML